ncbi:MAG: ATP-binding protein [Thermodesulfobacteriota bacterium]|jgi:signal transduction histidine kinase
MWSILRKTSLFFKVVLVTSLILIFAISFNVYWNTALHEGSIERLTQEKAKIVSEFIEKNVIRAMEKGRHFEIHRVLQNFATYKGIWKIHVFRPDGTIMATTYEGELNKKVENVDFYLKNRYFEKEEVLQNNAGKIVHEAVYYYVNPIQNRPECFQCHDKKNQVIGVLVVAESMREMHDMIYKVQIHSIILAIITIAFLSFVLGFLFLRFINVPIKKLTETMKKAEEGDLSVRVNVKSRDEMGRLAENLNIMIEKLNLAKQEAEQYHQELIQRADRMASIGELASGIAHEIRNPLAGIQGAIQIMAEGFPKEDPRTQVTDEIQKQIYKLERLVKDLLNFAKPVPKNYLPIDINQLVDKVLSFFMTQRGRSEDFKIEKRFVSSLPKTMIDPSSMEQAFLNIILNAQKAMPKGGTFTVSTVALPQRKDDGKEVQEVQIVFEDTGVGITGENLPKIFNPFFSTRSDGTGLGLSITKNIVEQQGGKIEVESQVNVGTKFIITLPAIN